MNQAPGTFGPGHVSEDVNAAASGFTLAVTPSLIGGHAAAGQIAHGFDVTSSAMFTPGIASVSVETSGFDLTMSAEFLGGIGFGEKQPVVITVGSALAGRRRGDALARGFALQARASFSPGQARIGHELTYIDADGSECLHTIYGASDDDLRDPAFMLGVITGDLAMCALAREARLQQELEAA